MRVLLTGAAGFIGSHVAELLLAAGHEVRGFDSLSPAVHGDRPGRLPAGLDLVTGDIRDPDTTDRMVAGVDAVCHQAALVGAAADLADLPAYADVNVTGTAVLLAAMARHGVPRLLLASSMVVYGEGGYRCQSHGQVRPPARSPHDLAAGKFEPRCPGCGGELATAAVRESEPLDPRNGYAASKVAQEHLAAAWARATQGSALALRYHNVYGPRMPRDTPYAGVAAIFRSALAAGQAPEVFEDGKQLRDFVHVRDVAQANLLALRQGQPGKLEPFNIASGEPRSIGEMAATLTGALGGPEPLVTGEFRAGDVRHIMASPAAAAAALGFRAEVAFADGMAGFATAPLREPAAAARVSAARRDQPAAG